MGIPKANIVALILNFGFMLMSFLGIIDALESGKGLSQLIAVSVSFVIFLCLFILAVCKNYTKFIL
jgi:hypothetical protein